MHPSPGDYLLRVAVNRPKPRDPVHSHHPGGCGRECNVASEQDWNSCRQANWVPTSSGKLSYFTAAGRKR